MIFIMQPNSIVSASEWETAHSAFMQKEKAFQTARDKLAEERRNLPWTRIDQDYLFQSDIGAIHLSDLFEGRGQLIIWHFMFGKDWKEGCPSCSFWADQYSPSSIHLNHRNVSLAAVSSAPIDVLLRYRERMGWTFPWVSSEGSDFNRHFGVTFSEEDIASDALLYNHQTLPASGQELPGLSVLAKTTGGVIYIT